MAEQEFYISKHYTSLEVDQRLLQGTYDDAVRKGYSGTKEEFDKLLATMISSGEPSDTGSSQLYDSSGKVIYPVTNTTSVVDNNGITLEEKLNDVDISNENQNKSIQSLFKQNENQSKINDTIPKLQKVTDEEMDSMIENGTWAAGVIYYTLEED